MKKLTAAVLTAALVMVPLTACSSGGSSGGSSSGGSSAATGQTAESIMAAVAENTAGADSASVTVVSNINMYYDLTEIYGDEVNADEAIMRFNMVTTMNMDVIAEPLAFASTTRVTTSDVGDEGTGSDVTYEVYGVPEDDGFAVYSGSEDYIREIMDISEYKNMGADVALAGEMAGSEDIRYTLADERENLDGREVYVLTGTMEGDSLSSVMGSMESLTSVLGEDALNLEGLTAGVTYYVYADDLMPAQMVIDMTELMEKLMSGFGIHMDDAAATYIFKGFDCVDEIIVPENVKNNSTFGDNTSAADASLPETGDGKVPGKLNTLDAPAQVGAWTRAYVNVDDGYYPVAVRVDCVNYGETADDAMKLFMENRGIDSYGSQIDGAANVAVQMTLYIPEDFPKEYLFGINAILVDDQGYSNTDVYAWLEWADLDAFNVGRGNEAVIIGVGQVQDGNMPTNLRIGDADGYETYVSIN